MINILIFLSISRVLPDKSRDLLTYPKVEKQSSEKCCDNSNYISCTAVKLNFEDFDTSTE